MKKKGSDVFVAPHPDGGWQVKSAKAKRAYRRTETQKEAVAIGRRVATRHQSELVIQRKDDGRIRNKDSHGHDSRKDPG